MKKDDIKIGATYTAKVSDRVVPIRIDRENARGGWDATNLVTNKQIRIKSAQRLRGETGAKGGAAVKTEAKAEKPAKKAKATAPSAEPTPEVNPAVEVITGQPLPGDAPAGKTKKAKAPKTPKEPKEKKLSCLDAAAQVLKDAGEPLQCRAMIDAMHAGKLWTSDAPTPAATLYSAILREIQKKGSESRFKKTERGHFALNA